MTKDKAIAELIRIWHSPHLDLSLKAGLGEAIDALKGADGDLISRQDAIKNAHFPTIDDAGYEVVRVDDILALPSAEPKTGEWIWDEEEGEYICSKCGRLADTDTTTGEWVLSRYCGDCGAYMVNHSSVYER